MIDKKLSTLCPARQDIVRELEALDPKEAELHAQREKLESTGDMDDDATVRKLGEVRTRIDLIPAARGRKVDALAEIDKIIAEVYNQEQCEHVALAHDFGESVVSNIAGLLAPFCATGEHEAREIARTLDFYIRARQLCGHPPVGHGSGQNSPAMAAEFLAQNREGLVKLQHEFKEKLKGLHALLPR